MEANRLRRARQGKKLPMSGVLALSISTTKSASSLNHMRHGRFLGILCSTREESWDVSRLASSRKAHSHRVRVRTGLPQKHRLALSGGC